MEISSTQNQRVKDAARLREKRGRQTQSRFIIDGGREILRAINSGWEIEELFVCPDWCERDDRQEFLQQLGEISQRIDDSTDVMEKLSFGQRQEGMVATARYKPIPSVTDLASSSTLVAVLEGIEKPGNLGALMRSADATGVDAIILADAHTDIFNPNAIRASAGTVFSVPIYSGTSTDVLDELEKRNFQILATHVTATVTYTDADLTKPTAIALGTEATGLSDHWIDDRVESIKLPMNGIADSLNVSATATVLFYEALRQRRCSTT